MFIAILTVILIFGALILCVRGLVKEKTAEDKEMADEQAKKATPDPNEFH